MHKFLAWSAILLKGFKEDQLEKVRNRTSSFQVFRFNYSGHHPLEWGPGLIVNFYWTTKFCFPSYLPQEYINLFAFPEHQSWTLSWNSSKKNLDKPGTIQARAGWAGKWGNIKYPTWLQSPSLKIELALARTSPPVPSSWNWDSIHDVCTLNSNIKALWSY